jgi:hypothetical protein
VQLHMDNVHITTDGHDITSKDITRFIDDGYGELKIMMSEPIDKLHASSFTIPINPEHPYEVGSQKATIVPPPVYPPSEYPNVYSSPKARIVPPPIYHSDYPYKVGSSKARIVPPPIYFNEVGSPKARIVPPPIYLSEYPPVYENPYVETNKLNVPYYGLKIKNFLDNFEGSYLELFDHDNDEMIIILNKCIHEVNCNTQKELKKLIIDLFNILKKKYKFKYNGLGGIGLKSHTDFTLYELQIYISCVSVSISEIKCEYKQPLNIKIKTLQLYLISLVKIAINIYKKSIVNVINIDNIYVINKILLNFDNDNKIKDSIDSDINYNIIDEEKNLLSNDNITINNFLDDADVKTSYNMILKLENSKVVEILNKCIQDLGKKTRINFKKIINDLFYYMRVYKHFKYNGIIGHGEGDVDFTLEELTNYKSCCTWDRKYFNKNDLDPQSKILQLYLTSLVNIAITSYIRDTQTSYDNNKKNVISIILSVFNDNRLIEDSVISYNRIIQKDSGNTVKFFIDYISDSNIILTGGSNDNKYYKKYLKYKTKYLKLAKKIII